MPNVKSARGPLSGLLMAVATMFLSQSCSSSSGGASQISSLCDQGCAKAAACSADSGVPITTASCKSSCLASATNDGGTCSNQSAIVAAAQACLAMSDCTAYITCVATTIPPCNGGSTGGGQGGSTGGGQGGSAGGQGGSTGSATCAICDKAGACCTALGGGTQCASLSTAMCNSAGTSQSTVIMACQQTLTAGAQLNTAACK
jgi:hypothetical protein